MKKIFIQIALHLAISSAVFAQGGDIWKNYESMDGVYKDDTQHQIISFINYPSGEFKTSESLTIRIYFNTQYDSLFKKESEKFKWIVKTLPDGASFNAKNGELTWKPKVEQIGKYEITFYIKYGEIIDSINSNITIVEEWNSAWTPGLSFTVYQPTNKSKFGNLMGPSVEYLLFTWIHRNDNQGPSHGKTYLKMDLLSSDNDSISESFLYSVGIDMSLERNARRNWLIPYFGLEIGGFYNSLINNVFYLSPIAGVWIYSSQNLFITADVKYLFPTQDFEDLKGYKANLGFNFSLW